MSEIKAVIGLGNPGAKYARTRHSIGFMVLDALAEKYSVHFSAEKNMETATITLNGERILLCKPQTFMNNSGEVIPHLAKKGIKAENMLVVHDELKNRSAQLPSKRVGVHVDITAYVRSLSIAALILCDYVLASDVLTTKIW